MFEDASKPNVSVSLYSPSLPAPSCCRVSVESVLAAPACAATQSVDDIVLPPILIRSLMKAISTTTNGTPIRFTMADTGATDHMVPDRNAFISYKSICGLRVRMGNNSFAPVLGRMTAILFEWSVSSHSQCAAHTWPSGSTLQSPRPSSSVWVWLFGESRDWHARLLPCRGLNG